MKPVPDSRRDADLDAELIYRYGGSLPRYTSYPTALQFTPSFGVAALREALDRRRADPAARPPSLYVHVPFCANPCFYCACTRVITRQREIVERYAERLLREAVLWGALWDGLPRGVRQLHFGGGTPTSFDDTQLARVMTALDRQFGFDAGEAREFSVEVDPRTVDAERLQVLARLGFNRISFGVQDLDARVQAAINREQPAALSAAAIDAARAAGFRSVSVDLIYGLPLQTPESFARTLAEVAAMQPDRIAVYAYAHLPAQFGAQRQIRPEQLPNAAARLALFRRAVEVFGAAGYRRIGMDHFALPGDELARALDDGTLQRNFQGYSTQAGQDLIGLGMSAISRIGDCYAQNSKQLDRYIACIDDGVLPTERGLRLDADDLLRRDVIDRVMCGGVVDAEAISGAHGVELWAYFADCLPQLLDFERDGLLRVDADGLTVTPRGRPLVRNIARVFDRYASGPARHSSAI
ncbi:oxygen-independent coproporphyrinogen III oxidase [Solimonas soli]|uniref:oxygen-independent coproporphyrinogen III oxidase n=1 Tax=Solimonas soli TaxID=413479 RepID=UPI0004B7A02D|nr:oxygen-independent coproporphyrinogen III oxidase [Solimonas soli]